MKNRSLFIKIILTLSISIILSTYSTVNILANENIENKEVLIGGNLIALNTQLKYPIVVNINEKSKIKKLDFLVSYKTKNSKKQKIEDISKLNEEFKSNKFLHLEIKRKNKIKTIKIKKDDIKDVKIENKYNPMGTLTYIDKENKIFGCVAHPLCLTEEIPFDIKSAKVTLPKFIGTRTYNSIKTVDAINSKKDKYIGTAHTNSRFGVFGKLDSEFNYEGYRPCKVGQFEDIKLGEAKVIFNNVVTNEPDEFKICITKINSRNKYKERGFEFEVADEILMEQSGGVLLGMSGSPIIQNNKIIGAVSHSNLKTGGSALYIGNMIK